MDFAVGAGTKCTGRDARVHAQNLSLYHNKYCLSVYKHKYNGNLQNSFLSYISAEIITLVKVMT